MSSFNIINEQKNSLNTVSYLDKKEHDLFYVSSSREYSFGNSPKDVVEIGIFNLQKELSVYTTVTSSKLDKSVKYQYTDVDGNSFEDVYNPSINTSFQDPDKNLLLSIEDVVSRESITSNNFYLSVNPIYNYFSRENPLTVKEISNSRKEVKLIKNFNSFEVSTEHKLVVGKNSITVDGEKLLKFRSGIVHVFKVFGTDVSKIRFSKVRGGTKNGSVDYTKNIIYKPSSGEILIDSTEEIPKSLFIYHIDITDYDTSIVFSEPVSLLDFKLNSEFESLNENKFIHREIYDEISYEFGSFNLTELYDSTKKSYSENIGYLRELLSFSDDSEVLELISAIYNGELDLDVNLGKSIKFLGIRDYVDNHFKFNFEFVGDFNELSNYLKSVVLSVSKNRMLFYNPNVFKSIEKKKVKMALEYLVDIFSLTTQTVVQNVKYGYDNKFKSPLKYSLNLGLGEFVQIISSKIVNKTELWVKLKSPLPQKVSVGDKISLSNISIIPTFELISWVGSKSNNFIKLRSPDFSLNIDEPSSRTISTKYYSNDDLSIVRSDKNKITINKKITDINVDYTDFSQFVVFSSANLRVKIFKNKIITLTSLNEDIDELEAIDSGSTSVSDRLSVYTDLTRKKSEYDEIISGFDGYESYLYKTNKFIYDTDLKLFVESSGSSEQSTFVEELLADSEVYDKNNRDSLLNNTPEFVYQDVDNDEYLKFLSMVGHHFDNIYLYISGIGIYKPVGHNIDDGLTGKVISYILNSLGFKLPPGLSGLIESADTVENYLSSTDQSGLKNNISIDEKTKTIWKRMLLNLPSIYKSKGTEECIRQIFSIYGIPNNLITFKEFGGGYDSHEISSSYITDDKEYLLEFTGESDQYVKISGSWDPFKSLDFKVYIDPTNYSSSRIIVPIHEKIGTKDDSSTQAYSFGFVKTGKTLGRFYFTIKDYNDQFTTFTDPVYLFSDDPMSVLLRRNYIDKKFGVEQSSSVTPIKYDIKVYRSSPGGKSIDVTTSFYLSGSLNDTFDAPGYITFGNASTLDIEIASEISNILQTEDSNSDIIKEYSSPFSADSLSGYSIDKFRGCLDKFTIQSTPLSDKDFFLRGKNFGAYYQGEPSSSYEDVTFRFGLGIPVDFSSASFTDEGYLVNNLNYTYSSSAAWVYNFSGSNFSSSLNTGSCVTQSYSYFPHQTREFIVNNEFSTKYTGPSRLENKKVTYSQLTLTDSRLFPDKSVSKKNNSEKYIDSKRIGIFVSPVHERNKDVLNFFGDHDIISAVAEPSDRYGRRYLKLDEYRRNFYKKNLVNKILFNELFSIYKIFIDKSIFETLKSVLPARNKVYSGILVEGSILERSRVEQKPVNISEITTMGSSISMKELVGESEMQRPLTSSIDIRYIVNNNTAEVYNNFSGYDCFKDRLNEFETNVFIGEGSYVEYDGQLYKAYKKRVKKQKTFSNGRQIRRSMYSVELVPSGSSLSSESYSQLSDMNQFRQISRKYLPFRNVSGKSRQTSDTTINDSGIEDRSPIIRISVGPNIRNSNTGLKV